MWVRGYSAGENCCLEVADDGPGIPEQARERVFKMFATSDSGGHAGIGLAMVADNAPRGALFRIRWPKQGLSNLECGSLLPL